MPRSTGTLFALAVLMAAGAAGAQQPNPESPKTESDQSAATETPAPAAATAQTASAAEEASKSSTQTAAAQKLAANSPRLDTVIVNGGPSRDILRSARNAGFKIKIVDGKAHFCKTEAPIGSHFVAEHCMNEEQVTLWLFRAQDQRDKVQNMLGAPATAH